MIVPCLPKYAEKTVIGWLFAKIKIENLNLVI